MDVAEVLFLQNPVSFPMSGLVDFIQNVLWVELDNEPNVAFSSFAKKIKIFFHLLKYSPWHMSSFIIYGSQGPYRT